MPDQRELQRIDSSLIRELLSGAAASPRLRINHNFHSGAADNPQRFLNALARGTYVCPHRHVSPPQSESLLVLHGDLAFLVFDDFGAVVSATLLGGDTIGIDAPPGIWHTVIALTAGALCFEVKPGPYCQSTDKEFASWAPREGDDRVVAYLAELTAKCLSLLG